MSPQREVARSGHVSSFVGLFMVMTGLSGGSIYHNFALFGRFQAIWSCPSLYLAHFASIGWAGVENFDFLFLGAKNDKTGFRELEN